MLLISCENQPQLSTYYVPTGIWMNFWDISDESALTDFNYYRFFGRYSHPHGVVVNLNCNTTIPLFAQLSQRTLFHNERFWLMFSANVGEAFDVLHLQKINVDAEIILAEPIDGNDVNGFALYEVFNPSSNHGGRLNITQLGSWNRIDGFNIAVKQTKIERRRDLHGITFSAVISVRKF